MEPQKKSNTAGIVIGVIVVLAVVLVTIFAGKKTGDTAPVTDQTTSETVPTTTETQIPPADTTKQSAFLYKDGTYTATGSYMSPGGPDQIKITLTLKNDVITDSTAVNMAGDPKSVRFQDMFISGYKTYVVGKNIADVKIGKVSGSSLTGTGFNDALAQIKVQAKA